MTNNETSSAAQNRKPDFFQYNTTGAKYVCYSCLAGRVFLSVERVKRQTNTTPTVEIQAIAMNVISMGVIVYSLVFNIGLSQPLRLSARISAFSAVKFLTAEFAEKNHAENRREIQELYFLRKSYIR